MGTEKKRAFIIDILYIVAVLAVAYLCMKYLLVWLLPFIIALFISFISQRPIRFISKHTKISQRIISLLFVLLIISSAIFLVFFLSYRVISELSRFLAVIPRWIQEGVSMVHFYIADLTEGVRIRVPEDLAEQFSSLLATLSNSLVSEVGALSSRAVSWLASKATGIPNLLVTFVITIIASFYISLDYETIKSFIVRQIPERYMALASSAKNTLVSGIVSMGKAYLILMSITFIELAVGLTVLKIEYSVTIAAITAIVDILPVLGTGTILIPWAIIEVIQGNYSLAIGLGVLYAIISVMRNVLEPRLVSKQLGLNPVLTLIMIYVGLQVFGLAGMFAFPIIMIILVAAQDAELIKIWK